MPTVAEQLRTAREQQGLSIKEVAELTKLRSDHVVALESEDYGAFPAPIYIRGFTRTYARTLKLDEDSLLAALQQELNANPMTHSGEDTASAPPRGFLEFVTLQLSRINWTITIILLLLLAIIGTGILGAHLWKNWQRQDPLDHLGKGEYSSDQSLPLEYLTLPETTNSPG